MQPSITNVHKVQVILTPMFSSTRKRKIKTISNPNDKPHKPDNKLLKTKQINPITPAKTAQTKTNKAIMSKDDIKTLIDSNNLFPPELPVKSAIGKYGLMWPQGIAFAHDAAPLLTSYSERGCPTDCGPQWTKQHIIAAITRGSHPTAKTPVARRYLINQTMAKVNENFAKIVKWGDIKQNIPKNLKISPIAMIPHKSRDYRSILDLSF